MRTRSKPRVARYTIPIKFRVRLWLTEQHHDQKWLAEKVGIYPSYLAMILAGLRTPSLKIAARLEAITGIEAREFCLVKGVSGSGRDVA